MKMLQKTSVIKYKGSNIAIDNFGGKTKTITGNPRDPKAPPKPDFEIATSITAKRAIGIKTCNSLINLKFDNASSIKF